MKPLLVYIDDEPEALDSFGEKLGRSAVFRVLPCPPPVPFDILPILAHDPDLVVVDYDLTARGAAGTAATYYGATLATALRERVDDVPLVLLTRRDLASHESRRFFIEGEQTFDWVIYKDELNAQPEAIAARLLDLVYGYQALSTKAQKNWKELLQSLGADEREEGSLREAVPPLHGTDKDGGSSWSTAQTAGWIINTLMKYPGILYDSLHAATVLGVDERGFEHEWVQQLFSDAKYTGCFAPPEGRWWKGRLVGIAAQLAAKHGVPGTINQAFYEAVGRENGPSLVPARCSVSGVSPADAVCFILKKPAMFRYTLAYFPDRRPKVMDEARVSYKAIRETNQVREEYLDPDAQAIVRLVLKGDNP